MRLCQKNEGKEEEEEEEEQTQYVLERERRLCQQSLKLVLDARKGFWKIFA